MARAWTDSRRPSGRRIEWPTMLFLDTHVALWLYCEPRRIPPATQLVIDGEELFISPIVRMEMSFLHEIRRITDDPEGIIGTLHRDLGLSVETDGWTRAVEVACRLSWTRDPFDRLITAHALCYSAGLCTRDSLIREHYAQAVWAE